MSENMLNILFKKLEKSISYQFFCHLCLKKQHSKVKTAIKKLMTTIN